MKAKNIVFIVPFIILIQLSCNKKQNIQASKNQPKTKSLLTKDSNDTLLNINDSILFYEVKNKFTFADSAPSLEYSNKLSFDYQYSFKYAEWLDDNLILIVSESSKQANKLLLFHTHTKKYKEIILDEIYTKYGNIDRVYGLSPQKDYLLFSIRESKPDNLYKLLAYNINDGNVFDIEAFVSDKKSIYKETNTIIPYDGRKYSFLPEIVSSYGLFSFTKNNGFQINTNSFLEDETDFSNELFSTITFPSLSEMISKKQDSQSIKPNIKSEKMKTKEIEKQFYFGNYYASLPIRYEKGKLFNIPRSNIDASFGLQPVIYDENEPYLFIAFHYYLNPDTLTPKFDSEKLGFSSRSNKKQARYTGLLVADKNTYELKKVLIHGIGSQHFYKRKDKYMLTSIFSDIGDNELVVWDLNTFKPLVKLNTERKSNYMRNLFFDQVNEQIIAVHSNPAKIFLWNYSVITK